MLFECAVCIIVAKVLKRTCSQPFKSAQCYAFSDIPDDWLTGESQSTSCIFLTKINASTKELLKGL